MDKVNEIMNELNDMANLKNFGEKVETEEKPLKQCQECVCKNCEQVAWLEQENASLKEEIEIRDNLSEKFRKEALSWANIANGYQKDKTKLKQTLQEIKAIAEKPKPFKDFSEIKTATEVEYDYATICNELELRLHKISMLITKAESEG